MKKQNRALRICLALALVMLIWAPLCIHAAIQSDFSVETDDGAGKAYYDGLTITSKGTPFTGNGEITGAYVAEDGRFLLVLSTAENVGYTDVVEVHEADGTFVCRLDIKSSGALGAFFDHEDGALVLYFAKGDVLIKVDKAGGYIDSCSVIASDASNEAQDALFYYSDDIKIWEIGGNRYELMKNVPGEPSAVRIDTFSVTDGSGETCYRYAQEMQTSAAIMSIVVPIVLVGCVIVLGVLFVRSRRREKRETKHGRRLK